MKIFACMLCGAAVWAVPFAVSAVDSPTVSSLLAVELAPDIFPKGATILFQGDSITHGGRLNDMNHFMGHGFAAEIAMRYLAYRPDGEYKFVNRGVSGATSVDMVGRWNAEAVPFSVTENGYDRVFGVQVGASCLPDVLSILVGINDYMEQGTRHVTAEDYKQNLRTMVRRALEANPKMRIVLCEPFRYPANTDPDFVRRQQIVAEVAAEHDLPCVPFQRLFSELLPKGRESRYWFWDDYHPTYAAHMLMADFYLKYLHDWYKTRRDSASVAVQTLRTDFDSTCYRRTSVPIETFDSRHCSRDAALPMGLDSSAPVPFSIRIS